MSLRPNHSSQRVGKSRGNDQDQKHLDEVRKRSWILKRMRGVGVEKSPTVCAEHFYRELRSNRALRDGLLRAFQCVHNVVRFEILHYALRNKKYCRQK